MNQDIHILENEKVVDVFYNNTTNKSYLTFFIDNFNDISNKSILMNVRVNVSKKDLKNYINKRIALLKVNQFEQNYYSNQENINTVQEDGEYLFEGSHIGLVEQFINNCKQSFSKK
jgi:hypothetical protein